MGVVALFAFLVLVLIGMPIAFAFATTGVIGLIILRGLEAGLSTLGAAPYTWASQYTLIAFPLFVLMGQFAFYAGISKDLYQTAYKWIGRLPGGLALATTLACTGFAACTGSSLASAATMGTIAVPEMKRMDYHPRLITGCVAAGGTLGILIPPSLIFIIYGTITEASIGKLFMAGIFPGIMLSAMFLVLIFIMCKRNSELGPHGLSFPWKDRLAALAGVSGALILFLLVIGGLYAGIFTPSEAGAIGAFGAFILFIIRGRVTRQNVTGALVESVRTACFALTILIGAMIFSSFLVVTGLPGMLTELVVNLPVPPYVIVILILLVYIPLGAVMDCLPMILLTMPVVFPAIAALGIDPIWFGVLVVVMSEMALVTPPVGMNAYIVHGVSGVPLEEVFRGVVPFVIVMLIGVALLVAFPQISLFLPGLMY